MSILTVVAFGSLVLVQILRESHEASNKKYKG
jgi:hypothetical protein